MSVAAIDQTPLVTLFSPAELAEAVSGTLSQAGDALSIGMVTTDSRAVERGQTFVALVGERFDGHAFVSQAGAIGAAGVVVKRGRTLSVPSSCFVVEVDDTTHALGDLARAVLRRRRALGAFEVYAITGSNGKTTTKELLSATLSDRAAVLKTAGNFNNWIGLPLTVFRLRASHDVAVLEMGANAHGEIRRLVAIAEPDVCLLTSLAPAHLAGFKSIEGVAQAKGELFEAARARRFVLPASVLHHFPQVRDDARVVTVGERGADLVVLEGEAQSDGVRGRYLVDGAEQVFSLPILGRHNVDNFGLVLAAVAERGLDVETIQRSLGTLELPSGRLQVLRYADGIEVLQDAYNANPASVRAALSVLTERAAPGRRIAVLGEMKELGAGSALLHDELGRTAAAMALGLLIAVGDADARSLADGALAAGMAPEALRVVGPDDVSTIVEALRDVAQAGDAILLKGSRAMALERVAHALGAHP